MVRVKICGLQNLEQAETALEAGADMLGFVFASSCRRVSPEKVASIIKQLRRKKIGAADFGFSGTVPYPLIVGVFVNENILTLRQIVSQCQLDMVQLHGEESPHYCSDIHIPVIKAFKVPSSMIETDGLLADIGGFEVVRIMLDAAQPGRGQRIDWRVAARVAKTYPILLAGGLDPGNVAEAIRQVKPWGVDVSSGVETDGVKDPAKIREFVKVAKMSS